MAARRDHGWWPYLGPYGLFLILVEIAGRTPDSIAGWMLALKVVAPAALLVAFAARGAYPELRRYRPGAAGLLADVLMGLAIAALWMAPFVLLPDANGRASVQFKLPGVVTTYRVLVDGHLDGREGRIGSGEGKIISQTSRD